MGEAPTLFDLPPAPLPARASDPETSKVAARQLDVRQRQAEVLRALRHLVVASTAEQIQERLFAFGLRREKAEIRSRLAELKDPRRFTEPMVRKVGVREAATGRPTTTWALTAAGTAYAKGLDQ